MLPANLPTLLREAGLEVTEVKGWQTRGRPGSFNPTGVLNHHTAASASTWTLAKMLAYAVWMAITGRSDLPAPLVQLSLSPTGRVFILAAGRSNHAGTARSSGTVGAGDGNTLYVGIEWMLSGTEKIPPAMLTAGVTLNAVLTHLLGTSENTVSCHYSTSVTGKWDIGDPNGVTGVISGHRVLDLPRFRAAVKVQQDHLYPKEPVVAPKPKTHGWTVGLSWNMRVGRGALTVRKGLTALIKGAGKPKFVVLNEARGYRAIIRAVALLLGYRVFQPANTKAVKGISREVGSTALLIRKGVPVIKSGVLRMSKRWEFYSGANRTGRKTVHEGRAFPWAVIPLDGIDTLVVAVHMPVDKHNPDKRDAWDETLAHIEALAETLGLTAFVLIGDWNDKYTSTDKRSPSALAKRLGGEVVKTKGSFIDFALVKGHDGAVHEGASEGSDHNSIRFSIEKD